MYNLLTD